MRSCSLLVLVACAHSAPPPAAPAEPPAASCATVVETVMKLPDKGGHTQDFGPIGVKLRDALAKSCEATHWSAEARNCFMAAHEQSEGDDCAERLLTQEQRDRAAADVGGVRPDDAAPA